MFWQHRGRLASPSTSRGPLIVRYSDPVSNGGPLRGEHETRDEMRTQYNTQYNVMREGTCGEGPNALRPLITHCNASVPPHGLPCSCSTWTTIARRRSAAGTSRRPRSRGRPSPSYSIGRSGQDRRRGGALAAPLCRTRLGKTGPTSSSASPGHALGAERRRVPWRSTASGNPSAGGGAAASSSSPSSLIGCSPSLSKSSGSGSSTSTSRSSTSMTFTTRPSRSTASADPSAGGGANCARYSMASSRSAAVDRSGVELRACELELPASGGSRAAIFKQPAHATRPSAVCGSNGRSNVQKGGVQKGGPTQR